MRALVIRRYGDSELSAGMAAAIMPPAFGGDALREELERMKQREARLAVRLTRDREYYRLKTIEAECHYGRNPTHSRAALAVWGMIGLVCETVHEWYSCLSARNREA